MPNDAAGFAAMPNPKTVSGGGLSLGRLATGSNDSIGAHVHEVIFRGRNYAIYKSDRGIYVHFADDDNVARQQRAAYVKLSSELCELRYLTTQMRRPGAVKAFCRKVGLPWPRGSSLLYEHNMAQALMLLMESAEQRMNKDDANADASEKEAELIAKRALDMAIQRNTTDNTIRYVRTCVVFALLWAAACASAYVLSHESKGEASDLGWRCFLLASIAGVLGATFSVIMRAQSFELKPCDDSGLNSLMSLIRVAMGGIAGPVLILLFTTVVPQAVAGTSGAGESTFRMIAILGLIGGFAERLVPNLIRGAAEKMEARAGTPVQATGKTQGA